MKTRKYMRSLLDVIRTYEDMEINAPVSTVGAGDTQTTHNQGHHIRRHNNNISTSNAALSMLDELEEEMHL